MEIKSRASGEIELAVEPGSRVKEGIAGAARSDRREPGRRGGGGHLFQAKLAEPNRLRTRRRWSETRRGQGRAAPDRLRGGAGFAEGCARRRPSVAGGRWPNGGRDRRRPRRPGGAPDQPRPQALDETVIRSPMRDVARSSAYVSGITNVGGGRR